MSTELIATARRLANYSANKPRQADLRRAVSTAYYALFHTLAKECADRFMSNYRGSPKHKSRPSVGRKGTLCPEWTHAHATVMQSGGGNPVSDVWQGSQAQVLFANATSNGDNRRYATARGIAFEAKPTGDGSWHGYPVPWESVPPTILEQWLNEDKVTRREVRLHRHYDSANIHWALGTDEP